jgi:hypothetical protein
MFVVVSCVQVMDKDRFLADDVVGRATLDLHKVGGVMQRISAMLCCAVLCCAVLCCAVVGQATLDLQKVGGVMRRMRTGQLSQPSCAD